MLDGAWSNTSRKRASEEGKQAGSSFMRFPVIATGKAGSGRVKKTSL
jgi:hypothetical protein